VTRPRLSDLPARADLLVVGGGITGAGVFSEAARTGATVVLVEQGDYASGTSSGSSKLVHGGLRYLKHGQWRLTRESVRERQRLLREAAGLVEAQPFLMPIYRGARPGRLAMQAGLWIYDRMAGAGATPSRWVGAGQALALEPHIRAEGLRGAMLYDDARTDDARLTLRLVFEALSPRAFARNYTRVIRLLERSGRVAGAVVQDAHDGTTREIEAAMVVNATGAWAGTLSGRGAPPLRPLRGSHYVFPAAAFPLGRAVSWMHPRDGRPIFAYPWLGATLYGTTDLDHHAESLEAPRMSAEESAYLLEGLHHQFPRLGLGAHDALSCYSAVRPVVAGGKADPSAESRESALWSSPGLVWITGGKLTTFRVTARQVLREAARQVPQLAPVPGTPVFAGNGRYVVPQPTQAARSEHVVQLDDLLLRRSRLGLLTERGAAGLLPQLRAGCQAALGWDDAQWQAQEQSYLRLWRERHAP
jgi:glycerol-3-phosphate dehydrogenase